MNQTFFILLIVAPGAAASSIAGAPEPDVIIYGHVTINPTSAACIPAGVTWSLSGNTETLVVSQTTVVSVNGEDLLPHPNPFRDAQTGRRHPAPSDQETPRAIHRKMNHQNLIDQMKIGTLRSLQNSPITIAS